MKYIYSSSVCLFLIFPIMLWGQEQSRPAYAGLDVVGGITMPVFYPGSLKLGVTAGLKVNEKNGISISMGFVNLKRAVIYSNLYNYQHTGGYLKVGWENHPSYYFSWGMRGGYLRMEESGQFLLMGNFFGDKIVEHEADLKQAIIIEPFASLWWRKWRHVSANISLGIPFLMLRTLRREVPVHFVSGFGFARGGDDYFLPFNGILSANLVFHSGR